ncbi:hypothetical protein [Pontiella sulfatireligans]|uniref:DUF302 domain-containing protein n=1 Tax=Pontiella sulfatireligans TaxID=2750658 RepID=A0A6C2UD91_9BACT|nr:hypothetical protein [Pontiella sulfatireligans]VGO18120.1 hypothetical protein SCARR_00171 [Pontiella sulfatireligans]
MLKRMWVLGLILCVCGVSWAAETVATDFKAAYLPLEALEQKLAANGLEVVGKHAVAGNKKYTSVVYTSKDLKKLAKNPNRGFIAVLRIMHNADKKEVVASNPEYFIRAFFQKDYKEGMEKPVMKALQSALGTLTPTADQLKTKKLAKYHFMMSMPYYDDFVRVAKGTTPDLMKKLEANAGDRVVFKLDLAGDGSSMLCGVALPKEIEKFNEKLDTMGRSHLLPYTVLIENGEANILHAKYYLALSFPQLTMTEFMKIMAVPGNIEDAFKADFQ